MEYIEDHPDNVCPSKSGGMSKMVTAMIGFFIASIGICLLTGGLVLSWTKSKDTALEARIQTLEKRPYVTTDNFKVQIHKNH